MEKGRLNSKDIHFSTRFDDRGNVIITGTVTIEMNVMIAAELYRRADEAATAEAKARIRNGIFKTVYGQIRDLALQMRPWLKRELREYNHPASMALEAILTATCEDSPPAAEEKE